MDIKDQIARLEASVARQERELAQLETEVAEIRRELEPFSTRYHEATRPLFERIEAVRAAISDLQAIKRRQRYGYEEEVDLDKLWQQTTPKQAPQKRTTPPPEMIQINRREEAPADIKQIYRKLARRYHPDLAQDDADRDHRTQLMAMINAAYQSRDLTTLLKLLDDGKTDEPVDSGLSLDTLRLRGLQQKSADLAIQIEDLKTERFDLLNSDMMELKLQDSLAKGRDLVQEIADDLQAQYQKLMLELNELRNSVQ